MMILYKSEVYKAIQGESRWDKDILNELILDTKKALGDLAMQIESIQTGLAQQEQAVKELRTQYDKVLSWADLFAGSSMEGKKMIVWQLIDKVNISRGYQIELEFKMNFAQFRELWRRGKEIKPEETAA